MHIHTSEQDSLELGFGNYSCNWGLHICGLYETEEERDKALEEHRAICSEESEKT